MIKFSDLNSTPPVGLLCLEGSRGTCFFVEYKDDNFMVTDYHVVKNKSGKFYSETALIEMETQDSTINNVLRLRFKFEDFKYWEAEDEDLFIMQIDMNSTKIEWSNKVIYQLGAFAFWEKDLESLWGNSIYTLGYPTSISRPSPFDKKPFLTRNTVCSFDNETNQFVIDAFSFFGNSGSPVFYTKGMGKLYLVGIIQRIIPFEMKWDNIFERNYSRVDWHHSGNTICKSSKVIKQLIVNGNPTH